MTPVFIRGDLGLSALASGVTRPTDGVFRITPIGRRITTGIGLKEPIKATASTDPVDELPGRLVTGTLAGVASDRVTDVGRGFIIAEVGVT